MTWVSIPVTLPDDGRLIPAGLDGFGVYVAILCWSNQKGWNGRTHRDRINANETVDLLLDLGVVTEPEPGWIAPVDPPDVGGLYRRWIPVHVRREVMERDGYECQECGATEDLSLDHIIPHGHGGPETVDNLRVLCRPCNSRRGNRV